MSESTSAVGLLHGLTYSVPIDGVIRMGYVVQRDGKRLPQKDDGFTITTKHKERGEWVLHPVDAALRQAHGEGEDKKLRRIPVKIAFDTPQLSINEQFAAFTREGRPLCIGDGCKAKRREKGQVTDVECAGPDNCEFGVQNRCDAFVRLLLQIDHPDAAGLHFVIRSGSINAVTDCRTVLEGMAKLYGKTAGLPMWLTLEAKSSTLSKQSVFWFASLRPRLSLLEGAQLLKKAREEEMAHGIDRAAFEQMLLQLRQNGAFAETAEDGEQIEDLILGRFIERTEDGPRSVEIGVERPGLSASLPEAVGQLAEELRRGAGGARNNGAGGGPQPAAMQ